MTSQICWIMVWLKIRKLEHLDKGAYSFYEMKKFLTCSSDDTFSEVIFCSGGNLETFDVSKTKVDGWFNRKMSKWPFAWQCEYGLSQLGYLKKKAGLSTYFFEKKPLEFLGLLLYLGNSGQIKASSLEMLQNCVTHPGNFETKNQDHFKFFAIFPWLSLKIWLIFFNPRKFHMLFLQYSWNIHVLEEPIS